jgi:voltage-gated potassium channel
MNAKVPFVVVDRDAARVEEAASERVLVFEGDATQEETLEAVGIGRAKALTTVLPNDALNVFITLTARTLNPNLRIVARGEDPRTESKLLQAGADRVVLPAAIGGDQIAQLIVHPLARDLFQHDALGSLGEICGVLGAELKALRITAGSRGVGKRVAELEAAAKGGYLVVAIKRADGRSLSAPRPDERFEAEDQILLFGRSDRMPDLDRAFAAPPNGARRELSAR